MPGCFEYLNLDLDTLSPKVQQAFVDSLKNKFGRQLDKFFCTTKTGCMSEVDSIDRVSDETYTVAVSENNTVIVCNSATGQLLHRLVGHNGRVLTVAISPDSKYIVTGSSDRTAKVWGSKTSQLLHTLYHGYPAVVGVAINHDNYIITRDCSVKKIWNMRYVTNTIKLSELIVCVKKRLSR